MSRDEQHGGGTWAFTNCVWAPTRKRNGGKWPFWDKVADIRQGDTIIHLRGVRPEAYFIGFSVASGDGFETTRRPPSAGEWSYAQSFYRADLSDFTPFHKPINLEDVLRARKVELEQYFDKNKMRSSDERNNLFFVRQAGRLQCLNGAYLSDVDEALLIALFDDNQKITSAPFSQPITKNIVSVETSSQISIVRSRLGQARFSSEIKKLYGNQCCFPECSIVDNRFLVAAHIARWSDNEELRGNLGNGLCFCLMHDRAFELGLFTLDEEFQIFINPREQHSLSPVVQNLLPFQGKKIRLAKILPLVDALLEHWVRVDIEPYL